MPTDKKYHLFGIRHHGPGSARMLVTELERLQPDCILIEGPTEIDNLIAYAADTDMVPPVAVMIYSTSTPRCTAFAPFTIFSPEWQAIQYGLRNEIPIKFMDLPQSNHLAMGLAAIEARRGTEADHDAEIPTPNPADPSSESIALNSDDKIHLARDPLDWLAKAAGFVDGEAWWDQFIEQRTDSRDVFAGIQEAMVALRKELPDFFSSNDEIAENYREAHMRQVLRSAIKNGYKNIAVVCGAWHVPALLELPSATKDRAVLKNLPKLKVIATWIPWSYSRIASNSGYAAGVSAPEYYEHLWLHANDSEQSNFTVTWLTRFAQFLRSENIDCSSAHIIEAVRLAETLAAFRGRHRPSIPELSEAAQAVMLMGETTHLRLIANKLFIGQRLGKVPDSVVSATVARDLARLQKTLRLKPSTTQRLLDLDLRNATDLERSYLLHRLQILNIPWGKKVDTPASAKGTFHEYWQLQWAPEFEINIVEASLWGNTVEAAAGSLICDKVSRETDLGVVAEMANQVLDANLPMAIDPTVAMLDTIAATTSSVTQLMTAIPSFARILRYSSVKDIDVEHVVRILDGIFERTCITLPMTCSSLDDEAANMMHKHILAVQQSVKMLGNPVYIDIWQQTLIALVNSYNLHGLLAGATTRLLLDEQIEAAHQIQVRLNLALSYGADPKAAADWLAGFLHHSGIILLHDDNLWMALDVWLTGLPELDFIRILPLLRRTFGQFPAGERRQIGERAKHQGPLATGVTPAVTEFDLESLHWDPQRTDLIIGGLAAIFLVKP